MAQDFMSVIGSIGSGVGTTTYWILIIFAVIIGALVLIGGLFLLFWTRKRYNLDIEIKQVRSDGKIVLGEWGKGLFNAKRGVLIIKRKKMSPVPIKIIDIRKYLQGSTLVTVLQVGARDFRPIIADSWTEHITEYEDEKTKEIVRVKDSVLNIKVDTAFLFLFLFPFSEQWFTTEH